MTHRDERSVIIDTDTAGDDTQALLMGLLSDRIDVTGITICAGNVAFDRQVENAKRTLELAGADEDVTVYEGARSPLQKEHELAHHIHGEGGLGGDRFPETGIESGEQFAVDYIVEQARANPGEITLACIAPLTNLALAYKQEPNLDELLDEVWVMGGAVNCLGNITPAAEYNFWVDPDAAKIVMNNFDVTLFDWGLTLRDTEFGPETLERIEAGPETPLTTFYTDITTQVRQFNRERMGQDAVTQPDSALVAALVEPDLIEETGTYAVDVDEREGLTRGYTAVDELGVTAGEPRTRVVETFDGERFETMFLEMLFEQRPDAALEA
ncbi:nucleoside hydrolase [Halorhabdus sp. CBA1104]|uniref:nucleoside hydrolase n=1 Tax=Halorhabdus sp. CBA1104 TaxID=1380432 RepID=UPI0012B1AB03|nr:nucleoside hydrolase [Halorhabdus sp. CBA1104]QGN07882.1 nucleoside hydrolase [Halorhabdus sp. CBA1104]